MIMQSFYQLTGMFVTVFGAIRGLGTEAIFLTSTRTTPGNTQFGGAIRNQIPQMTQTPQTTHQTTSTNKNESNFFYRPNFHQLISIPKDLFLFFHCGRNIGIFCLEKILGYQSILVLLTSLKKIFEFFGYIYLLLFRVHTDQISSLLWSLNFVKFIVGS